MIKDRHIIGILNEQQVHPDIVFWPDGGDFEVIDVRDKPVQLPRINNEQRFTNFLSTTAFQGTRIISISASSTISPLNISPSWTTRLLEAYNVRDEFLQVMLAFGDEPLHSEACNGHNILHTRGGQDFELIYKLNYVEPNHRGGSSPWSTRHLGVYHRHEADHDLYILLHCSKESMLYRKLVASAGKIQTPPCLPDGILEYSGNLHDLILQCYIQYWRPYLRWLEEDFSQINDCAMVARTSDPGHENFEQLRRLRQIRDDVDLASGYCMSNLEVLDSLRLSVETSSGDMGLVSSTETVVRSHVKSLKLLKDRTDNTIHLINLTLDTRVQEETARLNLEMKRLAEETSRVTRRLTKITENSANQGEVVRLVTIVSAIYLPGSFATSIFGMNFFQFNDEKGIAMSGGIWIFISFWAGLTMVTMAILALAYGRGRHEQPFLHLWKSPSGSRQESLPVSPEMV